jgi:hypothetical protein
MSRSGAASIDHLGPPIEGARRLQTVYSHLGAAAAALDRKDCGPVDGDLDDAAERLRGVEVVLAELARNAGAAPDRARQLRALHDAVSVHLSAAASLRHLDLDGNAAAVLRRAVDSITGSLTEIGQVPPRRSLHDAG